MEFIITTFNGTENFNFLDSCIYKIGSPEQMNWSNLTIWCSDKLQCHDGKRIIFDGYLFDRNYFYHRLQNEDVGILDPENCDGVFCYGLIDDNICLWSDPLGQYHLYYYVNNDGFIISNNINLLADLCAYLEQPIHKNIDAGLQNILLGGSLGSTTQYTEIKCLRVGESIKIRARELQLVQNKCVYRKLDYDEVLSFAKDRLVRNFNNFLKTVNDDINIDITAGNDSRSIFALAKHCKALKNVGVRNIMSPSHPDCNVATWFVEKYNLNVAKSFETKCVGSKAINNASYSAFLYGGCRNADGSYLSKKTLPDYIHLSGHFGEIAGKSTVGYINLDDVPVRKIAVHLSDIMLLRKKWTKVIDCISEQGVKRFRTSLVNELQYLIDSGVQPNNLVSELYLQSRCRSHFGMLSVHTNRYKVAPAFLALQALVNCRRALPSKLQVANKVIFDLIYHLGGEKVLFAPSNKPWQKDVVPNHLLNSYQNQQIIDLDSPPLANPIKLLDLQKLEADFVPLFSMKVAEKLKSKRFASEKNIKAFQQLIKKFINSDSNRYDVFNYDMISKLTVKSSSEFSPIQSSLLGQLSTIFIWMSNQEMKVYLDTPVQSKLL